MSEFWEKHRDAPRADFDRQVQIWQAGFLPEFVVTIHARPDGPSPERRWRRLESQEFVTKFAGLTSRARRRR